jgi:hypothetical protein
MAGRSEIAREPAASEGVEVAPARTCSGPGVDSGAGRVRLGRGPRAVEALLFAEVERLVEAARAEPAALARPVRVVVPSKSLAVHLSAELARRAGRAILGVSVRTVHALACEVVARAGIAVPAGEALFEILVRRAARAEPALEPLGALVDGHSVVAATVRDLLDAGLAPEQGEALDQALSARAGAAEREELALRERDLLERARAVVRVACELARELEAGRLGHRSRLFRLAREIVERDPQAGLPSRAVLIHGFADATGVVTDLLEALVRRAGATLFLDRPPDPADPASEDPGVRWSERFTARLVGAAGPARPDRSVGPGRSDAPGGWDEARAASEAPAPEAAGVPSALAVEVLHAPGPWAEARAVAEAARDALDAGALPERLAVVARDLGAHRLALRVQLTRLGVPFSGLGELGPPGPAGRRLGDFQALLRDGPRARSARWLEALELERGKRRLSPAERADLRVGLHALGAVRLAQVAALRTAGEGACEDLPLPLRAGLAADEDGGARAPRRRLPRALLDAAIAAARALLVSLAALEAPPARRPLAERAAAVREIARRDLGWRDSDPGARELDSALAEGTLGPPEFPVDAEELRLLLERRLASEGRVPLGGQGGGVQVLSVTEARARSFERLWVVGLGRDVFPRVVSEDPLLPDALRARLRALLIDLPLKRDGHDEERFLFAQLVAASPRVALLASTCDDDGRAREPSPLVERLRRAPRVAGPRGVPSATARAALEASGLRPACERALLAGLCGSARQFEELLPVALEEAWREAGALDPREATRERALELGPPASPEIPDPRALAAGRLAVLRELDGPAHRAAPLGPYFGFVGALREGGDPRAGPLAVTTLERLFRCPWQTFLARVLRLEAPPDAGAELPSADARRVGSLVHRVLERVARAGLGARVETLAEAAARRPVRLAWPPAEALEELVRETARELLREEGVGLAGFERVLALAAREPLAVARALDEGAPQAAAGIVGAEVGGGLRVADAAGAPRELRFRADRVDRVDGALLLTDYKTGRPALAQSREDRRREAWLRAVRSGELLQVPAYAAAARELDARVGFGRYLTLRPDAPEAAREIVARGDDAELLGAFEYAVRRAVGAWDAGSFFPRLVQPDGEREGTACRLCTLKEACLKGDSSARGRLARWTAEPSSGHRSTAGDALLARSPEEDALLGLSPAEDALLELWWPEGAS